MAKHKTKSRSNNDFEQRLQYDNENNSSSTYSSSSDTNSATRSSTQAGNTLSVDDESNCWKEYIDEDTQSPYYYNTRTHHSTWEKPTCLAESDMPT